MRKKSDVSIRDIARELGLNISTVSRALNHSYLVSGETTKTVLRKAHEMGYHFQGLKKNIVILLPSANIELAWYSINMINALQKHLLNNAYMWEFITEDNIDIIQERSISGMISLEFTRRIADKINKLYNIPLVCINNASSHIDDIYSVNSNAENAIRTAFGCLHDYGHENIAFINVGSTSFVGKKRKEAFEEIIKEYGLENSCFVVNIKGDKCNHGLVLDLYKKGITGIITDGESAGLKIWKSLSYCKIAVPEEMSLVAWEMPHVSEMVDPAITTISQDFDLIAEKAVQMLEMQFRNEKITQDVTIPYLLHMRDTVSIPRKI